MSTPEYRQPPIPPVESAKDATAKKSSAVYTPNRPHIEVSADKQIAIANIDNPHSEVKID